MSPETATYVRLAVYPSTRLPVYPSPLTASICPPGSFSSPSVASHASSITPAAARNAARAPAASYAPPIASGPRRSEEHTSELQSLAYLVCRLLLEKKKKITKEHSSSTRPAPIRHDHRT